MEDTQLFVPFDETQVIDQVIGCYQLDARYALDIVADEIFSNDLVFGTHFYFRWLVEIAMNSVAKRALAPSRLRNNQVKTI